MGNREKEASLRLRLTDWKVTTAFMLVLVALLMNVGAAFGQLHDTGIAIDETKKTFVGNDTITISGQVEQQQIRPDEDLSVIVYRPDSVVTEKGSISVSHDGSFSYAFRIAQENRMTGHYQFVVGYEDGGGTGSSFMYVEGPYVMQIEEKRIPINYKIDDGLVLNMTANVDEKFLLINTKEVRQLTLELNRDILDSKNGNADSNFIVFVDGVQKNDIEEIDNNNRTRTLTIQICDSAMVGSCGPSETKIIGTKIIPEFDSTSLAVLAAVMTGIVGIVAISKYKMMRLWDVRK